MNNLNSPFHKCIKFLWKLYISRVPRILIRSDLGQASRVIFEGVFSPTKEKIERNKKREFGPYMWRGIIRPVRRSEEFFEGKIGRILRFEFSTKFLNIRLNQSRNIIVAIIFKYLIILIFN